MFLLAIDTATNAGGVALARNAEVVGMVMMKTPRQYSENLIPMIEFVLEQNHVEPRDLQALVVPIGPGSFTGLRIGLAVVKALGQALDVPVVGLSTLEALAFQHRAVHNRVVAMMDARRQQVFAGAFAVSEQEVRQLTQERVAAPADWLAELPGGKFLFVGDGALLYRGCIESLASGARVLATDNQILDTLCRLGFRRYTQGLAGPVEELQARYLRPPDVRLNRELGPG